MSKVEQSQAKSSKAEQTRAKMSKVEQSQAKLSKELFGTECTAVSAIC